MTGKKKVCIVGGGISGFTLAHELCGSGKFDITIYEQREYGGRFVSRHAPKIINRFFNSTLEMYKEIPTPTGTVFDNLVETRTVTLNVGGKRYNVVNRWQALQFWGSVGSVFDVLGLFFACLNYTWNSERLIGVESGTYLEKYIAKESVPKVLNVTRAFAGSYKGISCNPVCESLCRNFFPFLLKQVGKTKYDYSFIFKDTIEESVFAPWKLYLESKGVKFVNERMKLNYLPEANQITSEVPYDLYILTGSFKTILDNVPELYFALNSEKKWTLARYYPWYSVGVTLTADSDVPEGFIGYLDHPWKLIVSKYGKVHSIVAVEPFSKVSSLNADIFTASKMDIIEELRREIGLKGVIDILGWSSETNPENGHVSTYNAVEDEVYFHAPSTVMSPEVFEEIDHDFLNINNTYITGDFITNSKFKSPASEKPNAVAKRLSEKLLKQEGISYDTSRYKTFKFWWEFK